MASPTAGDVTATGAVISGSVNHTGAVLKYKIDGIGTWRNFVSPQTIPDTLVADTDYTITVQATCDGEVIEEVITIHTLEANALAWTTEPVESAVTATGATITAAVNDVDAVLEYKVGEGEFVAFTSPQAITGLTAATEYTITVRATCDENSVPMITDTVVFTTATE